MSKRRKRRRKREQDWMEEQVDLTWLSLEQLGQAFQLLALPRPPDKLPKPFHKLNPSEWLALESLLVALLEQKQVQTVH
jgi:hypothetical protein